MASSANLVARLFSSKESSVTFKGIVTGMSALLDKAAGLCMFSIMALIVTNVILRAIADKAIIGTYEYVGYLTAVMICFSLANCAVKKGHIAVDYLMERLHPRIQAFADVLNNGIAFCFWSLTSWHVGIYAYTLSLRGVVSPTTQTPFYYFIYLVALGLLALSLVLFLSFIESIGKATESK